MRPTTTVDSINKTMKVYVCYLLEECEGTYSHATTDNWPTQLNFNDNKENAILPNETWIAFTDKVQAAMWVKEQEDKFQDLPYFYGADYREVELKFGADWILPFRPGDGL